MIVKILKHEREFAVMARAPLRLEELSFRARGLWAYLMTHSRHWEVRLQQLTAAGPEGRNAVQGALQELRTAGLAALESTRGADGRLAGRRWVIYEDPTLADNPRCRLSADRPPKNGIADVGNNDLPEILPHKEEQGKGSSKTEKEKRGPTQQARPGSVDAVQAYAAKKDLEDYAAAFFDHYESNGWRVGRGPMKDWRAAYRGWCRRQPEFGRARSSNQGLGERRPVNEFAP